MYIHCSTTVSTDSDFLWSSCILGLKAIQILRLGFPVPMVEPMARSSSEVFVSQIDCFSGLKTVRHNTIELEFFYYLLNRAGPHLICMLVKLAVILAIVHGSVNCKNNGSGQIQRGWQTWGGVYTTRRMPQDEGGGGL